MLDVGMCSIFGRAILVAIAIAGCLLYAFFRTNLGLAMRATGDNEQMIRALGVDVGWMNVLGLASLSNGLVALSRCLVSYNTWDMPTSRWGSEWSSGALRASLSANRWSARDRWDCSLPVW